jgi:hypothetical protein
LKVYRYTYCMLLACFDEVEVRPRRRIHLNGAEGFRPAQTTAQPSSKQNG